jgi:predicted NBD/HSP70 family sugar kinase
VSSPSPRLGLDLGGTKIAAVVLAADGRVLWEQRVATPRHDYDGTIARIAEIVAAAEAAVGTRCSVGVGTPGAISPTTGLVKNANSTWLNGRPLKVDLERALAREVRLANDANCLAVSEATDGAAAGAAIVFGVILGTGTGGGLVVRGQIVTGVNAIAGEWGHNPLPWPEAVELPGPACYCGRFGCLETWLSGPGIAADYRRRGGDALTSEQIVARIADDPFAADTMRAWTHRLARGLASIVNVLDPDVIVVGGGLSQIASLYTDVPQLWTQWVFSDVVHTRLVPAKFGDASGVRGAVWLWR